MPAPNDRDRRIVADRKTGMTYTAMEAKYNVTRQRCRQICKAAGLPNVYGKNHVYPPKPHHIFEQEMRRRADARHLEVEEETRRLAEFRARKAATLALRKQNP